MKRHPACIPILLFITIACSLVSPETPSPALTVPAQVAGSSTPAPANDPSVVPEVPVDASATDLPLAAVTVPAASPQAAVAHHRHGDPVALDAIMMIDTSNGWAVSGADVLFTADGAQTWREATPPENMTVGSQVQAQGAFLDAQHAWVIFSFDKQIPPEAVVWHTDDSGYTWLASPSLEHQISGEEVWAEFFAPDAMHVWLMIRGVYAGAGIHYVAQPFRSTDGGVTWLSLVGDGSFDYNYDHTGLVFADSANGLLTWQTTGAYAASPPEYAVTSDGAASWKVLQLPPPTGMRDLFTQYDYCEPFQPHIFSVNSIRMLVSCFDGYDPPHAFSSYLYSSEDGGSTWTSTRLPEKVLASQDSLFFFDKDNLLLLGQDIYRSADGGQSWDFVKTVSWKGQFTFIGPQTGWAIAHANDQAALVKTSNGGKTWSEIKPIIAP